MTMWMVFFREFAKRGISMKVSTVAIGEFLVGNTLEDLPLRHIQILPYNFPHSVIAGRFAKILLDARKEKGLEVSPRVLIPNDVKQLAQADFESDIRYFVTSDSKSYRKFTEVISKTEEVHFEHLDINESDYHNFFGLLDLE